MVLLGVGQFAQHIFQVVVDHQVMPMRTADDAVQLQTTCRLGMPQNCQLLRLCRAPHSRNYADFRAMRSGRCSKWHFPALRSLKLRIFRHSPSRKSSRSSAFLRRPFLTGGSSSLSNTRRFNSKSASTYR